MKRLFALLLCVCALCACTPSGAFSSSSGAESHSVLLALYDQEDYTPTGKYTESLFGQGDQASVEFTHPVPEFLSPEQQQAYVDAMTLWRAFTVKTGFELSNNRMYELAGKIYYQDLHYDTYADFADHLRTRFSYDLYNSLRVIYVPQGGESAGELELMGCSPYVEWDTRLYTLPAQAHDADNCPWPSSFELVDQSEDEVAFRAEYPDGVRTKLSMHRTDTGWQFTEFAVPYCLA